MASSSSAPPPKPSPYEVFLSFRGEDTRYNFVSHLRYALDRKGIIAFYDDKSLRYGENLPIELMKAIQESAIAIVVLSKHYASSTWCLSELMKIVECKNEGKLEIYPIFYDVEPTDVRKQQNSFFKAFKDHEDKFKDNMEMVNAWRKALTEVSNLKGVDVREKNEASCIEEIAGEILWKLPLEASHFTQSLVAMESRISDLKILINKNPDEVRFIGFWGMGGVGKTTTARAIFEECKRAFEGSCFLQDVRRGKNELEKLQQQLLSKVLKCKIEGIDDVVDGSSMISKRMCHKRVLVVVDDVDDIEQLDVLAGQWSWFGKGNRIIITTRNEQLLTDVHDKYAIDTLNVKEALHLFRHHAFKNEHPKENYKKLSHQVLRYAGGLPLALKVLGHHLRKQEESFWLATLRRLKEIPEEKIISKLQISFDEGLKRNEQDIFVYIACFYRGKSRVDVIKRLHALCLHPEEGIQVLIQKSLIHNDKYFVSFEMHDLLQDMGQDIVRQRVNGEVRRYSHLWLSEDIKKLLLDYKEFVEAEGIIIDDELYEDVTESKILKEESFKNMNKLRFLEINEAGRDEANVLQPSVQLPNGLRFLKWNMYPGKCLGKSFHPMNLVHLEMHHSLIEITPDFNHMPNLEELNLRYSEKLVLIHPSLGLHVKIRRIELSYCRNLMEFPAIIKMNALENLDLDYTGLQCFPEISGNVDSLKGISLNSTYIKGLPTSIKYATGLQNLYLGDCVLTTVPELPSSLKILYMGGKSHALTEYPKRFPSHLQTLKITHSKIEKTPDFNQLPNLLKLILSDCKELSEVHASLGLHKKIESIYLQDCLNLKEFPTIVDMGCLETLNLSGTKLQCFPEITGRVDNLEDLNLEGTCITTLPQSIGRATGLKELDLSSCRYLVSLPISLQNLEKLEIRFGGEIYSLKRKENYW